MAYTVEPNNPDAWMDLVPVGAPNPGAYLEEDPRRARAVFEFQRAMRLAPQLRDAALEAMRRKPGAVQEGRSVVNPFLEVQQRAMDRGLNPYQNGALAQMLLQGIPPEMIDNDATRGGLVVRQPGVVTTGQGPAVQGTPPFVATMPGGDLSPGSSGTVTMNIQPTREDRAQAAARVQRGPEPVMRRNAAGELYPTAGNYGAYSAAMGSLGLGDGERVSYKDALLAAARMKQAGAPVPDVPIAEVQALRGQQAAQAAAAAQQRADEQKSIERKHDITLKELENQGKVKAEEAKGRGAREADQEKDAREYGTLIRALEAPNDSGGLGGPDDTEVYVNGKTMTLGAVRSRISAIEEQYGGDPRVAATAPRPAPTGPAYPNYTLPETPKRAVPPGVIVNGVQIPGNVQQQLDAARAAGQVQSAKSLIENSAGMSPEQKKAAIAYLERA